MKVTSFVTLYAFLLQLFSLQVTAGGSKELPALPPEILTGTLDNGLTYYIRQNKKPLKRAELRLVVKTGSNEEDEKQLGLAHFTEHMAFNGTKHFKKNDLIDYLESLGTRFGPHLNAYTSFDETVYMFRIPTETDSVMDKGLQILQDWSCHLTFDSVEVEKERGVVIEEWRTGQGADERIRKQYWPSLFGESRYANRLPIGKKEILESFRHSDLIRFYKTWYKPENQAIIVVGDFDPLVVKEKIIRLFSQIKPSATPNPPHQWPVTDHKGIRTTVCTDHEATDHYTQLIYKMKLLTLKTEQDFREMLLRDIISEVYAMRFNEESQNPSAPYTAAYGGFGNLVNSCDAFYLYAMCKSNQTKACLGLLGNRLQQLKIHGVGQHEFGRTKKEILANAEKSNNEKDKTESRVHISGMVNHFLTGNVLLSPEKKLELTQKFLNEISLDEVNRFAASSLPDGSNNAICIIVGPDDLKPTLPTPPEAEKLYLAALTEKTSAPDDEDVSMLKIIEKEPVPGDVVSVNYDFFESPAGVVKAIGINRFVCSNGVTVWWKKTDFKNDEILIYSFAPGGIARIDENTFAKIRLSDRIIQSGGIGALNPQQLDKKLQGINAWVSPSASDISHGINGRSTVKDLEVAFQMIYALHTSFRQDSVAFNKLCQNYKNRLEHQHNSPEKVFSDTVNYFLSGYDFKKRPMRAEDINQLDLKASVEHFKNVFTGTDSLHFIFVGNIQEDTLKKLTEKYLASIPVKKGNKLEYDSRTLIPLYAADKTIYKGSENKASVQIVYNTPFEDSYENKLKINMMLSILNIKLRENLREDKSGVYGVGAWSYHEKYPKPICNVAISFGCSPANKDTLMAAVYQEIAKIKAGKIEPADLMKVKTTLLKEKETARRENRYWLSQLVIAIEEKKSIQEESKFEKLVEDVTMKDIELCARLCFPEQSRKTFVLLPDKK